MAAATALAVSWLFWASEPQAAPQGAKEARSPGAIAADIDRLINTRLADAKVPASPAADDAEFLRRATLDITGRIPSASKVSAFLANTDPDRRAKAIDELLADSEYGDHFGNIWYHRMVKPDDDNRQLISDNLIGWLAERFNKNDGWDKIVTELITAEGDRDKNPQTVFFLAHVGADKARQPEPDRLTASTSRLFLGVRLECAQCHNHPFTTFKQTDFWGMAGFFSAVHSEKTDRKASKGGADPVVLESTDAKRRKNKEAKDEPAPFGSIVIPDTKGKTVHVKFFQGEEPPVGLNTHLRSTLAAWMTSPENKYFAKAAVNKMWANFFGRGLVNPVDDMRPEFPPTHPELLDLLAKEFIDSGYNLKHLVRAICNSQAYQRTSRPLPDNKSDEELYSHMPLKVMSADMLYDSLQVALGHAAAEKERAKGKQQGKGAPRDPRSQFRKFFHAEADDDVGVVEDYTHGVPQALRLMNSPQLNDTSSRIKALVKEGGPDKLVDSLYLSILNRQPTDAERKRCQEYVATDKDTDRASGDLMWALINSSEFLFNH
jgi:hypothetical protein